mmetsp:Transcript_34688/g.91592  ORF Transcript_34688/g.91592 Transcript_34688/m.91592 type:complete len:301 (-) Transcript_34688:4-906(-)
MGQACCSKNEIPVDAKDELAPKNLALTGKMTPEVLNLIVADLEKLLKGQNFGPLLFRLSWHDAASFMMGRGGCPNAALRFTDSGEGADPHNAGLPTAAVGLLQPISNKYVPDKISNADLWALAANVAIRVMGGPDVPTRFGRKDAQSSKDGVESLTGRIPDGEKSVDHLKKVFTAKGFDDRDIVALSGGHTVGRCNLDRTGFDGFWTENPNTFDNSYFKEMLAKSYTLEMTAKDLPQNRCPISGTIMLNTDLALIQDKRFKKHVEIYAEDQDLWFKDFTKAWVQLQENGVGHDLYHVRPQ